MAGVALVGGLARGACVGSRGSIFVLGVGFLIVGLCVGLTSCFTATVGCAGATGFGGGGGKVKGFCRTRPSAALACGLAGGRPAIVAFTAHAFPVRDASVLAFFSGKVAGGSMVSVTGGAAHFAFLLDPLLLLGLSGKVFSTGLGGNGFGTGLAFLGGLAAAVLGDGAGEAAAVLGVGSALTGDIDLSSATVGVVR